MPMAEWKEDGSLVNITDRQPDYAYLPHAHHWDGEKWTKTYTDDQIAEILASWDQEKRAHKVACPRSPVKDWLSILPPRYTEGLEQNQKVGACCRHPENHEIEAWYANAEQEAKREPDIYIFHCTCGRKHRRLCVGAVDTRPFWEIR